MVRTQGKTLQLWVDGLEGLMTGAHEALKCQMLVISDPGGQRTIRLEELDSYLRKRTEVLKIRGQRNKKRMVKLDKLTC